MNRSTEEEREAGWKKERAQDLSYTSAILANEVNITPEGLRYYEKLGIGRAAQREDNGYRRYHPQEVVILRLVRILTAYGFTLREAIELVTQTAFSGEEILRRARSKRALLEEQIRQMQITLRRLDEHIHAVEHLASEGPQLWFEKRRAFYCLPYYTGHYARSHDQLNALLKRWMQLIPTAYPMPMLPKEDAQLPDPAIGGAMVMDQADLPDESYMDASLCRAYPERMYLCTTSRQTDFCGVTLREPQLQAALAQMKDMNLQIDGDLFFQSIAATESEDNLAIYYKVYIPFCPLT